MPSIDQTKILILATHGYERSELRVPFTELKKARRQPDDRFAHERADQELG